jgi:hypothetical protein
MNRRDTIRTICGLVAILLVGVARPSEAQYLDPGTGSIIVQALIAGAVGVLTVARLYWSRIRAFLGKADGETDDGR